MTSQSTLDRHRIPSRILLVRHQYLPSVFLSGLLISVDKLPTWARWVGHVTPLFYANAVVQNLIKPGGALGDDWASFAGLTIYGLVVLLLATRTLRQWD